MRDKEEVLIEKEILRENNGKINIIVDENGKSIVIINDIRFRGKQHID